MSTYISLLSALLLSVSLHAQSKLQISSTLYPNTSWVHNTPSDNYQFRPSLTGGVGIGYALSEHFSMESGVTYAIFSAHNEDQTTELYWGDQHDGNGGFDSSTPYRNLRSRTTIELLELPLQIRYRSSGSGPWNWYAATGASLATYLHQRTRDQVTDADGNTLQQGTRKYEKSGFTPASWSIMAAGGLERKIGGRLTLFGGPRLQWRHVNTGRLGIVTEYNGTSYLQLGLEIGVRFR